MSIKMQFPEFVNIKDSETSSTVVMVSPNCSFPLPKKNPELYLAHARKILDELNQEYDAIGISMLIAALIVESVGNGYDGLKNNVQ